MAANKIQIGSGFNFRFRKIKKDKNESAHDRHISSKDKPFWKKTNFFKTTYLQLSRFNIYAPVKELLIIPLALYSALLPFVTNSQILFYQIFTLKLSGRYILSPGFMPNAS